MQLTLVAEGTFTSKELNTLKWFNQYEEEFKVRYLNVMGIPFLSYYPLTLETMCGLYLTQDNLLGIPVNKEGIYLMDNGDKFVGKAVVPNEKEREMLFMQYCFESMIDGTISYIESDSQTISSFAFYHSSVNSAYFPEATSIGGHAFNYSSLVDIYMPKVSIIENDAFANCFMLQSITLPNTLTEIKESAFESCRSLNEVTFTVKPTTPLPTGAYTQIFRSCDNLTTINVPWSEGEVAGAPWGATNATINYNYTG